MRTEMADILNKAGKLAMAAGLTWVVSQGSISQAEAKAIDVAARPGKPSIVPSGIGSNGFPHNPNFENLPKPHMLHDTELDSDVNQDISVINGEAPLGPDQQAVQAAFSLPNWEMGPASEWGIDTTNIAKKLYDTNSDVYKKLIETEAYKKAFAQLTAVGSYASAQDGNNYEVQEAFTINSKGNIVMGGLCQEIVSDGSLPKRYVLLGYKEVGNKNIAVIYGVNLPDQSQDVIAAMSVDVTSRGKVIERAIVAAFEKKNADGSYTYEGMVKDPLATDTTAQSPESQIKPTPEPLQQTSADGFIYVNYKINSDGSMQRVDASGGGSSTGTETAWQIAGMTKEAYLSTAMDALPATLKDEFNKRLMLPDTDSQQIKFDYDQMAFIDSQGRSFHNEMTKDNVNPEKGWLTKVSDYHTDKTNTSFRIYLNPNGSRSGGKWYKNIQWNDYFKTNIDEWVANNYKDGLNNKIVDFEFVENFKDKDRDRHFVYTYFGNATGGAYEAFGSEEIGNHVHIRVYADDPKSSDMYSKALANGLIIAASGIYGEPPAQYLTGEASKYQDLIWKQSKTKMTPIVTVS